MKKITILAVCLLGTVFTGEVLAQDMKRKDVRKEVRMEDENGQKKLTIETTTNGVKTEEIYLGKEAEQKLAELEGKTSLKEETEEVKVEEIGGLKRVIIKKTKDGKVTEEILTGEEADKFINEMEGSKSMKKRVIKQDVRVVEKSVD